MALPTGWSGFAIVDCGSCLKAWPGATKEENVKAKALLKKLAGDKHLKTILEKRKWRVEVLRELTAQESKSHCGHNAGMGAKEIAIQLRTGPRLWSKDQCMKVMMHELSHNEHGPHDHKFYALEVHTYRELEKE